MQGILTICRVIVPDTFRGTWTVHPGIFRAPKHLSITVKIIAIRMIHNITRSIQVKLLQRILGDVRADVLMHNFTNA
jgi:hypothetical protein